MTMGQQKDRQGDLMVGWAEMPRSPGHVFYDRLQSVLIEGGFDGFAEAACRSYYAARLGAPSVPPGRYFRMHLVGYFEGIDSERGSGMALLGFPVATGVSTAGKPGSCAGPFLAVTTRARLPHEVDTAIFDFLALIAEAGLVKGERIGVDASTMEANAALRNIVRRDTGEGYRGMLARLAQESGIETPTAEDLARLDRKRKGKISRTRTGSRRATPRPPIAKMKDGPDPSWPTSPSTCRWIWTPARWWPPSYTLCRRGRRRAFRWRRPRRISRRWTPAPTAEARPNV